MKYIDLRSETLTYLTPEMRHSMLTATYGSHNNGEDENIIKLEKMAA